MSIKPFENRIWLSSPTMHGDELKYMTEAYTTNWMSTVGSNLNAIENMVCDVVGCENAVALSSGTAAIHMAIKLLNLEEGDRVFCTDTTFAATINPVLYEKLEPVFIDSEYDTWNMDPRALEKAFGKYPDTKAVIVADLYGTPAKYDEIVEICNRYGAILIEDAAEAMGAKYKKNQAGQFGKYNILSFNGNKIITGSSGGMLLTDEENGDKLVRKRSTQSREEANWYEHEEVGYNYRMSNVIAGVVRGQLPHLQEHIDRKKEIYMRYKEGFKELPVTMNPYDEENMEPNFWMSCMLIDEDAMSKQIRIDNTAEYANEDGKTCPEEILDKLQKLNAEGRAIFKPMHKQPMYKDKEFITVNGKDIGADLFHRGLCLPSDIKMTAEEQERVIEIVKSCF